MSDEDEYEFYDDEDSGGDKRRGYSDEENSDSDGEFSGVEEEEDICKTDGFRVCEQAGRPEDEDLDLQYRGVIEGGGDLARIQQRHDMMFQDPLEKFKLDVQSILQTNIFQYDNRDKTIIKKRINNLPFIRYKNPDAYVYSYHLYSVLPPEKSKDLKERLKQLEKRTSKNSNMTMFEIIKYAYYWKDVLITLE